MAYNISAIAFDVGNTLILDPFEKVLKLKSIDLRRIFSKHGYDLPIQEITEAWRESNKRINEPDISHFYQESKTVNNCLDLLKVGKKDKSRIASEVLITYRSGLMTVISKEARNEKIKQALTQFKSMGKKMAVFGNGRQKAAELFLAWAGFYSLFSHVTMSERLGIEKPDMRVYNYIQKTLGVPSDKILYVGDYPENDVGPVKKAGMKTALYLPSGSDLNEGKCKKRKSLYRPDIKFTDFEKLLEFVK